jgi:hypothetical protein
MGVERPAQARLKIGSDGHPVADIDRQDRQTTLAPPVLKAGVPRWVTMNDGDETRFESARCDPQLRFRELDGAGLHLREVSDEHEELAARQQRRPELVVRLDVKPLVVAALECDGCFRSHFC